MPEWQAIGAFENADRQGAAGTFAKPHPEVQQGLKPQLLQASD